MFTIIWYIFLVFTITTSIVWIIENNGSLIINWLGYEIQTDILTATLIFAFFLVFIALISYILTRLLSIKFPQLLKLLFKKSYTKKLEKIITNHHKGFETLTKLLLAIEVDDYESAKKIHKDFSKQIKYKNLNNFFEAKFALENNDFTISEKYFAQYDRNPHAKILSLKSKLKIAIKANADAKAIELAKQILTLKKDSIKTAQELLKLYKKIGNWQSIKSLINEFGAEKFKEELQKRDLVILNTSLAFEALKNKKYLRAIKYCKMALSNDDQFLPAHEILIKSWIRLGFKFKAISIIKKLWKENPYIILVEIYDSLYRKASLKKRIHAVKKLAILNSDSTIGNIAIAIVAYRAGAFQIAKEFLNLALVTEKTQNLYRLLAYTEKHLGNNVEFLKNLSISKTFPKNSEYICNNCMHSSVKWSATCDKCSSYDSIQWNNKL
jgi:HemY protein